MSYVNCARHVGEQNLIVMQQSDDIFYEVSRDIYAGTEMLVWYGDDYIQVMGIPVTLKGVVGEEENQLQKESDSKLV